MHFKCKKADLPEYELYIDGISLERKIFNKFLGVYINENLKWDDHVKHIILPISRNVGLLTKLQYFLPTRVLFTLYNALILPYISYCNIIWATHKCNTDRILLLQKKSNASVQSSTLSRSHRPIVFPA